MIVSLACYEFFQYSTPTTTFTIYQNTIEYIKQMLKDIKYKSKTTEKLNQKNVFFL